MERGRGLEVLEKDFVDFVNGLSSLPRDERFGGVFPRKLDNGVFIVSTGSDGTFAVLPVEEKGFLCAPLPGSALNRVGAMDRFVQISGEVDLEREPVVDVVLRAGFGRNGHDAIFEPDIWVIESRANVSWCFHSEERNDLDPVVRRFFAQNPNLSVVQLNQLIEHARIRLSEVVLDIDRG